jgi:AraC family transcriptional regulator
MEPKIVEKDETTLVGMVFYGDPFREEPGWSEGNEIGKLWERFTEKSDLVKNVSSQGAYEIHIEPKEFEETKRYYVFVGVEVERPEDVPPEMFVKVFPPTKYAVFTFKGEDITSNWADRIFKKWLPDSGYEEAGKFVLEYYDDERFKGMENLEESELDVWVPVRESE